MAPIRPEDHAFVFQAVVLSETRRELGLNQAQLAELLDVPVNTLSRWERGSNLPDANALAALFSIAKERGVTPEFFKERRSVITNRHDRKTLVTQWDYQNMALEADDIEGFCPELREYMHLIFPRAEDFVAAAYTPPIHRLGTPWDVGANLKKAGFDVKPLHFNANQELVREGEKIFNLPPDPNNRTVVILTSWLGGLWPTAIHEGIDPAKAVYVLISNDGGYTDFVKRLQAASVEVFVCGNNDCSERLVKAVGPDRFIPWQRPYMVAKCYEMARKLTGKSITKGSFGNQCRVALEEDGFEGDDYEELLEKTGFSLNRPFASALQHMNTMGILRVKQSENDPNRVALTIPGRCRADD